MSFVNDKVMQHSENKSIWALKVGHLQLWQKFYFVGTLIFSTLLNNVHGFDSNDSQMFQNFSIFGQKTPYKIDTHDERINRGKSAFEDLIRSNEQALSAAQKSHGRGWEEVGCWQFVLKELQSLSVDSCDTMGEATRSLVALARTRCHFLKSKRPFPNVSEHCYLDATQLPDEIVQSDLKIIQSHLQTLQSESTESRLDLDIIYDYIDSNSDLDPMTEYQTFDNNSFNSELNMTSDASKSQALMNPCKVLAFMKKEVLTKGHELSVTDELNRTMGECEMLKHRMVNRCIRRNTMSDLAFQMYHTDLNHIDDICFYLQSSAWNQRVQQNINRLTDSASLIADQMANSLENFDKIEKYQQKQLEGVNRFEKWLHDVKGDFVEVFRVISEIQKIQRYISEYLHRLNIMFFYLASAVFVFIFTIPQRASGSRLKIYVILLLILLLESATSKFVEYLVTTVFHFERVLNFLKSSLPFLRWLFIGTSSYIWIHTVTMYQSPIELLSTRMDTLISKIENASKLQTYKSEFLTSKETPIKDLSAENDLKSVLHTWLDYLKALDSDNDSGDSDFQLSDTENFEISTLQFDKRQCRRNPTRKARPQSFKRSLSLTHGIPNFENPDHFYKLMTHPSTPRWFTSSIPVCNSTTESTEKQDSINIVKNISSSHQNDSFSTTASPKKCTSRSRQSSKITPHFITPEVSETYTTIHIPSENIRTYRRKQLSFDN